MRAWMLTVAAALVGAQAGAEPTVVYEQASMTTEEDTTSGYYSNALWNELLYDDVTLKRSTDLHAVEIWGYGFALDPMITVSLFADAAGEIGALIDSRTFDGSTVPFELTGGWIAEGHWTWPEEFATFELDPPMRLEGGRKYWVRVAGTYELVWSYDALSGNDHIFYSNADGTSFWDQNDTDMAFRLIGQDASPADLAEPFGTLDFSDVVAFLGAFASGDDAADLAPPLGTLDFTDIVAFLAAFAG